MPLKTNCPPSNKNNKFERTIKPIVIKIPFKKTLPPSPLAIKTAINTLKIFIITFTAGTISEFNEKILIISAKISTKNTDNIMANKHPFIIFFQKSLTFIFFNIKKPPNVYTTYSEEFLLLLIFFCCFNNFSCFNYFFFNFRDSNRCSRTADYAVNCS